MTCEPISRLNFGRVIAGAATPAVAADEVWRIVADYIKETENRIIDAEFAATGALNDLAAVRKEYTSMLALARALHQNAKDKPGGLTKDDGVFIVEHTIAALSDTLTSIDRSRPEVAAVTANKETSE